MTQWILQSLSVLSREAKVLLLAAMPIIELRGAIPVAISLGMTPFHAFILSFVGSILPVPFLLLGIRPVFKMMSRGRVSKQWVEWLSKRGLRRSDRVKKYGFWGLILFVGIPLPGTGVWTGTLMAALLDIRFKVAFPAIFIGNLIAGILISLLSHGAFGLLGMF